MPTARFHFSSFFISLFAAVMLYGTWGWWEATAPAWQAMDEATFFALNGSLEGHPWWQTYWAFGNSTAFDMLSSTALAALLFWFAWDKNPEQLMRNLSIAFWVVIACVIAVMIGKNFMAWGRHSPSLVLEPAIMLAEKVSWISTKDLSYNSYPSDHATVLLMAALCLTRLSPGRIAFCAWIVAIIFVTPRLVGGAHWLSDMLAGGLPLALCVSTIMFDTPLFAHATRYIHKILDRPFFHESLKVVLNPEAPSLIFKGMCMGTADIIPGVSGGTIAYIFGIWHRLIAAINSFNLSWFRLIFTLQWTQALKRGHFRFAVPLAVGIIAAIILFTQVIPMPLLITTHPKPVYGLFFGLISASIVLLIGELGKLKIREIGLLIIGTAMGWLLVTLVPVDTPETMWFVFLCGCIAISAMLLPGLSGSFILLILGKYGYILDALGTFKLAVIAPFIAGCLVGIIAFSRFAGWLLQRFYRPTVLAIAGILIGSLWIIWPFQERTYVTVREKARLIHSTPIWPDQWNNTMFLAIALALVGIGFIVVLHRFAQQSEARVKINEQPTGKAH